MMRRMEALPPGLPPRPDLGRFQMNVGFLLTPTRFLERCHERCGDFFTLRPQAGRYVVLTSDPATVKQVFTGDPSLLHAGEGNIVLAPLLGSRSVLLLDGPEHLRQRRLLLPPFHGERIKAQRDTIAAVAERHIAGWPRRGSLAVLPSMQAITLEVVLRLVLGATDEARIARIGPPLRRVLDVLASPPRVVALGLTAGRTGPRSPWSRFLRLREDADRVLYEEIAARKLGQFDLSHDVLSLLLSARDEDGEALTDEELRDELMTLLVAGHETSATALAWTLERLVRTPEVLDRARSGDEAYVEAVVKEALRLRPVVPAVVRRLQAPMTFGPYDLPAGVHIAPSIYLLHRRPDLYPEPLAFRPERFLGTDAPGTYEWIPFGGGVRRCLGAAFAMLEMKTVLEVVLREVALRAQPGRRDEPTARRAITFAPLRGGRVALAGR